MNSISNLFDEVEAELIQQFKNTTPKQLAEHERRRKIKADHEAIHTPIETDEERANTDEYPEDEE